MTKSYPCIAAALYLVAGPAFAALDDAAATAILTKAGCRACHAVDKKMVGPSYQEIAKKYKGDAKAVATLAEKVRKGGSGNWGGVPMPPSPPAKISDADLNAVVEWILTK
jgi:cytochrome c